MQHTNIHSLFSLFFSIVLVMVVSFFGFAPHTRVQAETSERFQILSESYFHDHLAIVGSRADLTQ